MFEQYKKILSLRVAFGCTLGVALFFMLMGVVFWGGFNTVLEQTNDMSFCISCHEMEDNVYPEYLETIHYKNRTGIRATCPDCHVPKEWQHMVLRKINASKEIFHKLVGSIDTKEKFSLKREKLANKVWHDMTTTNSRECRNCHHFDAMDSKAQKSRSGLVHFYGQQRNKTCINCHKGIAHQLPEGITPYRGGSDDDHDYYQKQQVKCYQCHKDMPQVKEEDWGF